MKILDCTNAKNKFLVSIKKQMTLFMKKNIKPTLAIIEMKNDYPNNIFRKNVISICNQLNIKVVTKKISSKMPLNEIATKIINLNKNKNINGILIQTPLNKKINSDKIFNLIEPIKDVDCLSAYSKGKIMLSPKKNNLIAPCVSSAIIYLLHYYKINLCGKLVAIINRSNIIGKPLSMLILKENATVIICHSKTKNLKKISKMADIVICAIGKANYFNESFFKKNAIIIDVGINYDKDNKICGDVNLKTFKNFKGHIITTPGGVGPITILQLINNLLVLTWMQYNLHN